MAESSHERRLNRYRISRSTNPRFRHPIHSDAGLQPERSSLSWVRTCLSLFVLLLIQLRMGHFTLLPTIIIIVAVTWTFFTATNRYEAQARGIANEKYHPNTTQILGLAGVVIVMGVAMMVSLF